MYSSLDDGSPLKEFLRTNCSHLLKLDFKDSAILIGTSASPVTRHPVKGPKGEGHPSNYILHAGVYVFESVSTGAQYIGSAISLQTRYLAHMTNSTRPNRGGNSHFYTSVHRLGG
jgi:hypothetical protein